MSKMTPEIRFKGFEMPWEITSLGDNSAPLKYGLNAPAVAYDGTNKYIRITDIDENTRQFKTECVMSPGVDINFANDYLVQQHDLLFARTGASVGKSYLYSEEDGKVYYAGFLIRARLNDNIDANFIFQNTQTSNYYSFVKLTSQRSGQPGINAEEYSSYRFNIPKELTEQKYIGVFFKSIDTLGISLEREITRLEKMKLASLQKMFPRPGETVPEIRFKGFNEPWKIEKLGKLAKKTTEKNNQSIYTEIFTCSAEYGIVNQRDYFDHNIAKADKINGYQIVEPNVFVYNPRVSTIAPYGPIIRNKTERTGVISPLYTLFKFTETISYEYLDWYFKTSYWHEFMKLNGDNGARHDRFSIGTELFFDMPIVLPSLTEQQKVAEYFENLETILAAKRQKLEKLRNIKKACLEKMFVNNTTEQ